MPELDKKIGDVIRTHLCNDESSEMQSAIAIPLIKQAFIDAGWFVPADAKLVQEVANMRAQQKVDAVQHTADFSRGELSKLMTGQEWYDRFSLEVKESLKYYAKETRQKILNVAKKAAGIE